ncbi:MULTISPECIES: NAD-dependent epimerase/dehydratase family protein [Thermoprotei]|uniref:NAD-dependent epimerase/dehydratase family protein n=1 Tax=Thermoprotei TaxID=183924 RepID=UPI003163D7AF
MFFVLDSLERSTGFALERLRAVGVPVVRADVRSFDGYSGFDVAVHATAYVSVPESIERPIEYLDNNALGTARVAYNCARHGVRLVYLSSAAVYGDPVKLPIPEGHPVNPVSPYGFSKWLGELAVSHFGSVYGPGQNPSYAGVVASFLERALRGEPLVVYGDGEQTRDFIYVDDVSEAVLRIIEEDAFDSEVYNVGTGRPITIRMLAEAVKRVVGRELDIVFKDPRPGDIRHSYADNTKLLRKFRVSFTQLETGLRKTLELQYNQ